MKKTNSQAAKQLSVAILIGSFTIAVAILIYTLVVFVTKQNNVTDPQAAYENIGIVKTDSSPFLGDPNAPVTVIEYTDFDCPVCKLASDQILPSLKNEYIQTGKVKFLFKSLPVEATHPNAFRKTEAAYCARDLGGDKAFFAYYDSLFAKFGFSFNLDNELVTLAQANGLDAEQFRNCLMSGRYKERIKEEVLEANLIGSLGTPTWLIGRSNGTAVTDAVKVNGLLEYANFQRIINKHLNSVHTR